MRTVFNRTLVEIAGRNRGIYLVLADIGYGEIEEFAERFPERYLNVGVAEQNMAGVACGIALEGNTAVTYSIANFPTLRCLEQIRNDICYHKADVKIVIIGGGLAYGSLGVSHHSTEDIAIMRALPEMVVLAPCDFAEAEAAARAMFCRKGPVYYRCGYKNEKPVHAGEIDFRIGKAIKVIEGRDAVIISTGTITRRGLEAVSILKEKGIDAGLVSMHTVKPIDRDAVAEAARVSGAVITLEEHNISGGLGSAVAEVLCDEGLQGVLFKRIALPDEYVHCVGSHDWLLDRYGYHPENIASSVENLLSGPGRRAFEFPGVQPEGKAQR